MIIPFMIGFLMDKTFTGREGMVIGDRSGSAKKDRGYNADDGTQNLRFKRLFEYGWEFVNWTHNHH